jgi:hypothetical protein
MGEWRLTITALKNQISILKQQNVQTIQIAELERWLNNLEDDFEINDKNLILDKINNPRREYNKNLDHYIKFFKEQNAEYRQYTQLVITAGYAAFFGLWNISNGYIEPHMSMWIFLLLAISAFSFIILEAVKVGLDGFGIHIKNNVLLAARVEDNQDLISDKFALADKYKNRFDLWTSRIWVISYPVSLLTGVSAIFLLAFSIGSSLLNNL